MGVFLDAERGLVFAAAAMNNGYMEIRGRVHNGVVVLDGGAPLPEGIEVVVSCQLASGTPSASGKMRIAFPLVPSHQPSTVPLTSERIAEILAEEDESPRY